MATIDLSKYGITGTTEIIRNPSYEFLFDEEMRSDLTGYDKGQLTDLGAVNVMTGIYTGRSPKDKFIVMDDVSRDTVWWTSDEFKNDNKPASRWPRSSCPTSGCSSWTCSAAPTTTPAWPSASSWKWRGRPTS